MFDIAYLLKKSEESLDSTKERLLYSYELQQQGLSRDLFNRYFDPVWDALWNVCDDEGIINQTIDNSHKLSHLFQYCKRQGAKPCFFSYLFAVTRIKLELAKTTFNLGFVERIVLMLESYYHFIVENDDDPTMPLQTLLAYGHEVVKFIESHFKRRKNHVKEAQSDGLFCLVIRVHLSLIELHQTLFPSRQTSQLTKLLAIPNLLERAYTSIAASRQLIALAKCCVRLSKPMKAINAYQKSKIILETHIENTEWDEERQRSVKQKMDLLYELAKVYQQIGSAVQQWETLVEILVLSVAYRLLDADLLEQLSDVSLYDHWSSHRMKQLVLQTGHSKKIRKLLLSQITLLHRALGVREKISPYSVSTVKTLNKLVTAYGKMAQVGRHFRLDSISDKVTEMLFVGEMLPLDSQIVLCDSVDRLGDLYAIQADRESSVDLKNQWQQESERLLNTTYMMLCDILNDTDLKSSSGRVGWIHNKPVYLGHWHVVHKKIAFCSIKMAHRFSVLGDIKTQKTFLIQAYQIFLSYQFEPGMEHLLSLMTQEPALASELQHPICNLCYRVLRRISFWGSKDSVRSKKSMDEKIKEGISLFYNEVTLEKG